VQELLSSVRETQQGQDFLESQAAADQLQLHLTQSQQSCEEAVEDEITGKLLSLSILLLMLHI